MAQIWLFTNKFSIQFKHGQFFFSCETGVDTKSIHLYYYKAIKFCGCSLEWTRARGSGIGHKFSGSGWDEENSPAQGSTALTHLPILSFVTCLQINK